MDEQMETTSSSNGKPASAAAVKAVNPAGNGKRKRAGVVLLVLLLVGSILGFRFWVRSKTHVTTDNAFVEAHVHSVSARVPGTIVKVPVRDNQLVKQGDLLVELDAGDYDVRVRNAAAGLAIARNETSGDYAKIEEKKAATTNASARLEQAELDLRRGRALFAREVLPKEQLDRLETVRKATAAQLQEAEEGVRRAQAELGLAGNGGKGARVAQKESQLKEAQLNLSYTRVYAPADGYVTRKSAEPGNNVQAGQPLMAIVALDDAWVTANYKERQLTQVKPGQAVEFEVDTYPGRTFRGRVESIMAGTGAAFSLLPPENATGNYVKVVQRIPVKIVVDKTSDPEHVLRVGMSVVPTIMTGRSLVDILKDLNPFSTP
jgi:membrane fusion protein (multidrug efflux system)